MRSTTKGGGGARNRDIRLSGSQREMQKAVDFAIENGWSVELTEKTHLKFTKGPDMVIAAMTSRDAQYAVARAVSRMRQAMRLREGSLQQAS